MSEENFLAVSEVLGESKQHLRYSLPFGNLYCRRTVSVEMVDGQHSIQIGHHKP